jgi:non-heme chloroperoxidase
MRAGVAVFCCLVLATCVGQKGAGHDPSPHSIRFVMVDRDVKLEVLDWGGSGKPLVFMAGLGNTAHIFDDFAPKLAGQYHVYGITRRGFGASSTPAPIAVNYTADRLGDDVLAVCAALKLERPVLAGHSIAGEELSSVGSRYPERMAGLIYLDAGYGYAFYDSAHGDLRIDSLEVQKKLDVLFGVGSGDPKLLAKELLEADLPRLAKDLREAQKDYEAIPSLAAPVSRPSAPSSTTAIIAGEQKYTGFRGVPVLAIFALPHETSPYLKNTAEAAAREARERETGGARVKAFEAGIESAHVVVLAHANHYVFRSNEADVLREMNSFLAGLQ